MTARFNCIMDRRMRVQIQQIGTQHTCFSTRVTTFKIILTNSEKKAEKVRFFYHLQNY